MFNSVDLLEAITPSDRGEDRNSREHRTGMGNNQNPIQTYGALLSDSQRDLVSRISTKCFNSAKESNGIWLQDVILCSTPGNARDLVRKLQRYIDSYGRSVMLITSHDSHVHVNHDCAYAGGSCRCYWRKEIQKKEEYQFRRRLLRPGGRRRIRDLNLSDWQRIVLYFSTEGRQSIAPYINGQVSNELVLSFM